MALAHPPDGTPPHKLALAPPKTRRHAAPPAVELAVVVVNFCQWRNTARLVNQLRRSIAVRTGQAEIRVIDNGSPSHPLAARVAKLRGVSVCRFDANLGFAAAVNRGCRQTAGPWVLLLNPDITVPDGFLDDVLGRAARGDLAADVGVIGFRLLNRDGTPQPSAGPFPSFGRTLAGLFLSRARRKCRVNHGDAGRPVEWATGGCFLVRRECFEQLGGLDESFFLYYEDVDFCKRAAEPGWRVWFDPALEVTHHWPLHARRVPPPLRLVTRHALLTYAKRHWAGWQARLLSGVVWAEAGAAPVVGEGAGRVGNRPLLRPTPPPGRGRGRRARRGHRRAHPLRRRVPPPHRRGAGRPHVVSAEEKVLSADNNARAGTRPAECGTEFSALSSQHSALLSIVIPSHSRPDLLRLCLASVGRFAPPLTEVIVVDDGSRDAVVSRAAAEFAGVTVVRRPKAGGFCAAANAGIAAASAPVVELLNDDAEVTEGWADAALAWFTDARVAAVAPLVLQNDPARRARGLPPLVDTAGDEYDYGGFAVKRGHNQETGDRRQETGRQEAETRAAVLSALSPVSCLLSPGIVFGASACAAFYRRDALLRAGGFPEHFGAYFEDVDLSFRLRRLGFEIVYDPAAVVWHRVSGSYGRAPSRRTLERQSCNEERVFWRNVRGRRLVKCLPRHAAVLVAKAVRRWQEGALLPWLMGRTRAVFSCSWHRSPDR